LPEICTQGLYLAVVADPQWVRTWPQRIAGAGKAFWFYLGKLAWPSPLMTIYPRWQIEAGQIFSYVPLAAALGLLTLLWLKREVWPRAWFFAFAYFLVVLLPVSGLIDNPIFQYSLVFDHFQYLASMGPLALAGAGLARLSGLLMQKQAGAQAIAGVGLLLILGMLSGKRTWVYENQETLWTAELAENADCWLGHNNLGFALAQKGRIDDALAQFQQCLDINPNYAEAHNNLGAMLLKKGRLGEAMAQFQKAVDIDPEHNADANYNLGLVLSQKGRLVEAMVQFKRCLEVNPRDAQAYFSMGVMAFQNGQWDEAMAKFRKALEVDPNYANAYYNLGVTLFQKGRLEELWPSTKGPWLLTPAMRRHTITWVLCSFDRGGWMRPYPNSKKPWKSIPTTRTRKTT
jgi:tetratricopeptide (TPR) repeat protein